MTVRWAGGFAVLLFLAGTASGQVSGERSTARRSGYEHLSYDDFMAAEPLSRVDLFRLFSPKKRAEIVAAHIRQWRDANADRLSPQARDGLKEAIAFATPSMYGGGPLSPRLKKAADAFSMRMRALFSEQDYKAAFVWIGGEESADR
jgi:hypothetical protein